MNLHIKQRTLERLRMYKSLTLSFEGTNFPAQVWRAFQGAADRTQAHGVREQTLEQMGAAHDATIAQEGWVRPEFPENAHPEFDDAAFERWLRTCVVALVVGFASVVLGIVYFSRHEHQGPGHLPAAQAEKGELAK